jgi:hypothetical protein
VDLKSCFFGLVSRQNSMSVIKNTKITWQRWCNGLNRTGWRAGHKGSARFRALSSEIGGQELIPFQTSDRVDLEWWSE